MIISQGEIPFHNTLLGHALAKINPGENEQDNPALLTFQKLCWIFTGYLKF